MKWIVVLRESNRIMENNNEIWVFLSHSHEDYEKVRKVRDMLEDQHMRPLMFFLKCLNDHDEIDSLIKREIDCRTRFILCDTEESRKSAWVQREVEYIKSKDRNFDVLDLTTDEENVLKQIEEIKKKATIFISYNRDEYMLAEQVYDRLCKYDFDLKFDRYFLRSGCDYAKEIMTSIDEACKKGTVVALLKERVLSKGSFVRTELAKALEYDQSQSSCSIMPFYLDHGLERRLIDDSQLSKLSKYKSVDLTKYDQEKRADIVVNEVLKKHYRPGTILFYSELFGNKDEVNYDLEESIKLKKLHEEIMKKKFSFWSKLFGIGK